MKTTLSIAIAISLVLPLSAAFENWTNKEGNTAQLELLEVTGEGDITLNSHYLLDALGALDGDTVSLCFNGKLEPCLIKDAKSTDYTHIIMPLKS